MNLLLRNIALVLLFLLFGEHLYAQEPNPNLVPAEDRICFALYTVHENTLKLTAQMYPIRDYEPFEASLEIEKDGQWEWVADADIIYPGYTAPFRIENWDDSKEYKYRVSHNKTAFYEGIIRKNPKDKDEIVMAAFSCNSVYPNHGGDISREDIVENMKFLKPDLLFFAGDQVYHHSEHLTYWLKFGRDFGEIISNTPTICLPDDHDIGQGNLWGQGGVKAAERRGHLGGYYMPVEYIKEVERAQTSHLPDPFDPTPIERGISVYYTDLKWGGISFAILEDRKFKSGLAQVAKENPEVFPNGPFEALFDPEIDTRKLDVVDASLLGERQLSFLENWTTDWKDAEMKAVLSQTIFAMTNNYTGKHDKEIFADFDSNGWPQSGRNKALSVIRKSFSCMITGDQHLANVLRHGIDDWGDAGYSFATPAIANYWLRWWNPATPGKNKAADRPDYTGDYLDGFQNKMTMLAVANPTLPEIKEGGHLSTRAAGYGVIRFNKAERSTTFECWPRNVRMSDPEAKQYKDWPIKIFQMDNFEIKEGFELPSLQISEKDQVVTVRDEYSKEVISSIRIQGNEYQPKVLEEGKYTLEIGEGNSIKRIFGLNAQKRNSEKLSITF